MYSLTPEHKAQLPAWRAKWIANAFSTAPMDDQEKIQLKEAVQGLYRAAKYEPPPDDRIIFVPSPFALRFAGGFAAAIWYLYAHPGIKIQQSATPPPTTTPAKGKPTWYRYPVNQMIEVAKALGGENAHFLLSCANSANQLWDGGNQWSGYAAYLSFYRHVVQLPIDFSKWAHYEALAAAGPRIAHEKFCMISERPDILTVDGQNRPHNETGPFCRWRDGSLLYAWHGVHVPWPIIEHPESITRETIEAEGNIEVQRVMLERYGEGRYMQEAGAELIHEDKFGQLFKLQRKDRDPMTVVRVINTTPEADGSKKVYWLPVDHLLRPLRTGNILGDPQEMTARNAVASTFGLAGEEYNPEHES